jgi:hypothetical protein
VKNGCEGDTAPPDFVFDRWCPLITQAYLAAYGYDLDLPERLPEILKKAGFVNVQEEVVRVPVGTWPRDEKRRYFGILNREIMLASLQPLATKPLLNSGLTQSDLNALISEMEDTLNDDKIHTYTDYGFVYAQKP